MYKKFIGFLTVLFLAFSINVVAGDTQYFLESTDENYPADGYMCSDSDYTGDAFLNAALNPETSVRMTPVFRKNCKPGYSRQPESEDENPLLATCKVTTWICNPGEYLDLTDKEHPRCTSCPAGYWCPVNSGVSNYTEYESLSISTNDSVYCTVNGVDYSAGGTVDDEESRTAAGKCACPTGTTTAANNLYSHYGLNVQSIDGCMYHILEPGQQLKKNDVDGTYAVAPCDADHYCPGSMGGKYTFTVSNASDSMKNCPYKENHIYPSLVTKEQCEGDNYGTGYKWENGRCVINSEDICNAKAIELGVDFKWVNGKCMLRGHSEPGSFRCSYDCPVGYSMHVMSNWNNQNSTCEPCPIGYYCPDSITYFMPTVGYSSKWENGKCKNRITDAIITGITADDCAEYMVDSDGQHIRDYKDANKYYGESVNNEPPKCPNNKTTKERGATSEDDCYATIYCAPGTYLVAGESECRPCDENANANNIWENGKCYRVTTNGNHEEREEIKYVKFKPDCLGKNYCPGGYFLTNQMGESGYTGMYTCRPQAVTGDYGEPISAWDDIDGETINPTWTDAATFIKCSPYVNGCMASHNCIGDLAVCNNVIMSKKTHNEYSGADACSCPKGYEWNYETRACCDRYKVCCGPGFMPLTNTQTGAIVGCTQCNGEWADNSYCTGESVKIACSLPRDPSNLEVVIGYRYNSQCHTCVAGAVPGRQTEDNGYCNCSDAKMYEKVDNADTNTSTYLHLDLYPEAVDYHTSDDDHKPNNIRHWRIDLNQCVLKDFTAYIRYVGIAKDGSISYLERQKFWQQRFAYGHKIDKVGDDDLYTQTESFDIPASALPADGVYRGYNFTEEYEFKEEAELGNNGLKAEGADGYLFAGWCRDKSFCCPKGYKAKGVNGGKRVCEYCNGSVAYDEDYTKDCSGSAYTKATDVVTRHKT